MKFYSNLNWCFVHLDLLSETWWWVYHLFFGLEWIILGIWVSTRTAKLKWEVQGVKRILNSRIFLTGSKFARCHLKVPLTWYSVSHCFLLWRLHCMPWRTNWYFGMIILKRAGSLSYTISTVKTTTYCHCETKLWETRFCTGRGS